jgi:hypothetical protein
MPTPNSQDDKKRLDPYDPRTGATGNDEPIENEDVESDDDDVETDGKELGG